MDTFDDGAMSSNLLSERWGLTGVSVLERLQTYPTRFVERIVSDQGCFAVKFDAQPDSAAEGSEQVQAALASALPRHVPAMTPDLSGALYVVDNGRRVTVFEDISGGPPASGTATWRGLGAILAQMHALPAVPRAFDIPVQAGANELDRLADDYPFADEFRLLALRIWRISEQPSATIHGEVNLGNARLRPDGDLVLVDWDAAGVGPIAVDLGYPLICVFHDEDLTWHVDHATAFYAGYAENCAAAVPSAEQIFDAALMHALRYLRFWNTAKRWARAQHAVRHEARLVEFLTRALDSS
ncbi:phosphotransferase [Actinopolymorpha sp. B9G3]|uniref:phosphotransferase enzyme family protein n=1 Tax=Actinopolymorpha sp. B9G3 TaxID=3158970 RepID=UPI0032D993DF